MNIINPLIAVLIVSLISVIFAVPFFIKKNISNKVLLFLLSLSVGALLAAVFVHFLPEIISEGYTLNSALYLLAGFLAMFILEKFIHFHHHSKKEKEMHGHSHAYHLAPINLIGDGIHNFIDGLVIAGSFAVSPYVGITATIAIVLHEIPQEIADFGILLYSGLSKKKALMFNFLSSVTAIAGTVVGLILIENLHGFTSFIIPFAAGNFLYIAASSLLPELHKECNFKDTILHILAIILGIGIITMFTIYGPTHSHENQEQSHLEETGHLDSELAHDYEDRQDGLPIDNYEQENITTSNYIHEE